MARPLSASAFLAALRAEGVRLCENCVDSDWDMHNRGPFAADVVAIVNHHTASNATPTSLIRDGRSDLRGPLSIGHMTRDTGMIHLVGYGRCNHAGMLCGNVLAAAGDGRTAPAPGRDSVNGNLVTYSIEVNGTDDGQPFTPAMLDNLVRYNTAICRAHGWNANHVIGHREATRRKPTDPAGVAMSTLRSLVTARLAQPLPTTSAPTPQGARMFIAKATGQNAQYLIQENGGTWVPEEDDSARLQAAGVPLVTDLHPDLLAGLIRGGAPKPA